MTPFRFLTIFPILVMTASPAFAQAIDWKSLGRPVDEDAVGMYDRLVYSQTETTTDKKVGVEKPVVTPVDVAEWLSQNIPGLYALNRNDYDQKTIVNQRYFTPKGYAEYISSLNAAKLPSVVKEKGFRLSAVVTDPPNVLAKGVRDEAPKGQVDAAGNPVANPPSKMVYVWQLDAPVNLTYIGDGLDNVKTYKVSLKVELVRVPMKEDGTLIAINGWRLEEYKSTILPESLQTESSDAQSF